MSKLNFDSITISDAGGTANGNTLSKLITDSVELNTEDQNVTIEDGQEIPESFLSSFTVRSRTVNYDDATAVTADSRIWADPAADTLTEVRLTFNGVGGSVSPYLDNVYVSARPDYSDGRKTLMLRCSRESDSFPINEA